MTDLPPTPPPPVYAHAPIRSQSPQIIEPQNSRPLPLRQQTISPPPQAHGNSISKKSSRSNLHTSQSPRLDTHVQVFSPESSNYIDDQLQDGGKLSPILSHFPGRKLSPAVPMSIDSAHRRVVSENVQSHFSPIDLPSPARSTNGDAPPEIHEPLQYHHQVRNNARQDSLEKRTSGLALGLGVSESGSTSSSLNIGQQTPIRNSFLGADLQRPGSAHSDLRGRGLSNQSSPGGHMRAGSRNSRSPDARPLSYVDLLNVPYPQQAPSGAENLVNQGLRTVVGENASLLSTKKTLDMYRANVKKTNDPAIQYEFAIFMIGAAQEPGLEQEMETGSSSSGKSITNIRQDLIKEAKVILQRLCDKSYPFAQYYLADGFASGLFNNGKPDLDRSFPLFLAASKHGHAEAMYRTALCYEYGWGCRVDAAKAVQFFQHAASKNHPGAMLRLGRACLTGEMGLTKRYREGIRWLKRGSEAADLQYNQAPYDLACLHEEGYGPDVFKDEAYAAQLFTKAADLGHKDAAFRLGEAYEYGQLNCPKDPALSVHFYTTAAEQGHASAQMALCAWYMVGVDNVLEKDEGEAYEWAKRAAEQGLAKAQYTLGYFTEMGIGCRRDPLEANVWYVRAADQGEERAKHRIAAIRAASTGADPMTAATSRKGKTATTATNGTTSSAEKKKKFGLF